MLLFNQMKINKLTVSRDCAEPSTESMKPKLTFLFILTFLFLFSGSVYGQGEVKKEYLGEGKLKSKMCCNDENS